MVWKLLGTGSAIVAGIVSKKVITIIWKKAGHDSEIDPTNPDIPFREALAYAALAGVAAGLARTFTTRQAAAIYQRSAGHLPKPMREDIEEELSEGGRNADEISKHSRKRS
ncbi:DUF4235 domain-containing protein [Janibacter cremeus]|uniref:DUF4235 domain-containing protein n=1 Tax=Janibacter cremeus TaxID=1285192 RepID=UPI0023F98108|nr:DUF4235 domain-containing protein [Janibacter cremeus]WEV79809.1 DUF4235 domain-containing protein [Janibacter cremeus]